MPYERVGNEVFKVENGKRVSKGKSKDAATAKAHMRALYAAESKGGWNPKG